MVWERPPPPRAVWEQLPPGPRGLPVVGSAVAFRRDPLGFLTRCYQTYGRSFTVPWFGYPVVFLVGPDANRVLLSEQAPRLAWRPALTNLIPLIGDGLTVTDGELHVHQRRLTLAAFRRERMEGYVPITWDCATRFFDRWRPGQVVELDAALHHLTVQIAGRTLFGVDLAGEGTARSTAPSGRKASARAPARSAVLNRDLQRLYAYTDRQWPFYLLKLDLPFTAWGRFVRARARLDGFVYRRIREHQADRASGADALTALLEARDADGSGLSTRQVRDQMVTLLAAVHDQLGHGMTWALYLLAQHPAVLERVLVEQRAVLAGRAATPDTVGQLSYLELVIKETLRLYPLSWAGPRVVAEEFRFQDYRIPAGAVVVYVQWLSHRLPEIFHDPEAFRPERFDPEHGESHPPYAYVPFGGGARPCIGMSFGLQAMKVALSALLGRWRLELEPGQRIVPRPVTFLGPREDIRVRVHVA